MMEFLTNTSYCRDSHWGNGYESNHMVIIDMKDVYNPCQDWINCVEEIDRHFNEDRYNRVKEIFKDKTEEMLKRMCTESTITLKPEIIKWLNKNIEHRNDKESPHGWAMGSKDYNAGTKVTLPIWFHRRRDALKFIKEWSEFKKPVLYFNYFKNIRRELDFNTMKLVDTD